MLKLALILAPFFASCSGPGEAAAGSAAAAPIFFCSVDWHCGGDPSIIGAGTAESGIQNDACNRAAAAARNAAGQRCAGKGPARFKSCNCTFQAGGGRRPLTLADAVAKPGDGPAAR